MLYSPDDLWAIGQCYDDFSQVTDQQVESLLSRAAEPGAAQSLGPASSAVRALDSEVAVRAGELRLGGHLAIPESARGIVIFAHGSGSSRHSPRNQNVALVLNRAALGTLLFDLLTPGEESDRSNVFDLALLAHRLAGATDWLRTVPDAHGLPVGYFGASTGAGAALLAAAEPNANVEAIVSRGGRPDLAAPRLGEVRAPTLLIVGGLDRTVLQLNHGALAQLRCEARLAVVPGATHLFEEPGTLESAAELARD